MRKYVQRILFYITMICLGIAVFGNISEAIAKAKGKKYTISTNSKPCNKKYVKSEAFNKNTKHYFLIRSYLEKLGKTGGTLVLKKGNYKVCSTLYVPSNVTIKLNSKTKITKTDISETDKCKPTKYLFQLAAKSKAKKKSVKAYKSSRNVSIIGASGATINLNGIKGAIGISMAHNYNINIQKIDFKNRNGGSYIALSGTKKIIINNCRFFKGTDVSSAENYYDIRMETANAEIDTLAFSWSNLDNTINENIQILNNYFSGSLGAIGTTKYAYPKIGKKKVKTILYQEKIKITGNKFNNIGGHTIKGMAWRNTTISSNEFYRTDKTTKTSYGIYLYGASEPTMKGNRFNYVKTPIRFGTAKNSGKGAAFTAVKNSISSAKITLLEKNTVKNPDHYYILCNNGSDKRIAYYIDSKDNNLTISKSSPTYRERYTDYASYGSNTKDYFLFESYMEQLEGCGGGTLTVKAGTYNISNGIHVPSNVSIIFENGVIINKIAAKYVNTLTTPKAIFIFVAPSLAKTKGTVKSYNGTHDVKFFSKGRATIDCGYQSPGQGLILGHNKNITISGIDFKRQKGYHFIELNSSNNVIIENCTFREFSPVEKTATESDMTYKESVNIDGTDIKTNGFNYDWSSHDKTACKNVTIRNCEFTNVGTAIGSHTYSANGNTQIYHENIKIYNNTIKNTLNSGIRALNWKNAEITKNNFDSIGYSESLGKYGYYLYGVYLRGVIDPVIKNNTFTNTKWPISLKRIETAKPTASAYADTISKLSNESWEAMLDNIMIDCEYDYVKLLDTFLDMEIPENFATTPFKNISHEYR